MISLMIVDDHETVRTGLASLLKGTEITIIAEAANGKEAVAIAVKKKPEIILLDVRMPFGDGLSVLEELRAKVPESRVVMLTTYRNPTYIIHAADLGASDYMTKGSSREDLIAMITDVAAGKSPSPYGEMCHMDLCRKEISQVSEDEALLTQREMQVLRCVALGLNDKEIAGAIEIDIETVKKQLRNILRKIAVGNRTQAAVWAVRRGIV